MLSVFQKKKLRKYFDAVSLCLAAFAILALLMPFWPEISFLFEKPVVISKNETGVLLRGSPLANAKEIKVDTKPQVLGEMKYENRLALSDIGVDSEIHEGTDERTLLKGIWRWPASSTPDKGGNTVLLAHRWMETEGPRTFYHLDKMKVGDSIQIIWQGKQYLYKVFETKIVESTATYIEDNTAEPIITLYTCTPLWTSTHRIVVRAALVEM